MVQIRVEKNRIEREKGKESPIPNPSNDAATRDLPRPVDAGSDLIGVREGDPRLTNANPRVDRLGLSA
jgi:hypothetical protein